MSVTEDRSVASDSRWSGSATCKPLLDIATPEIFRTNAFRITGLPVDATTREITKRANKLKIMGELGDGEAAHTHAFALSPPPTVDQIRLAIEKLRDPEKRIIDECFWFWPDEFGNSVSDPAIQALAGGDRETALKIWTAKETSPTGVTALHNIAVLWHLVALEWEEYLVHDEVDNERDRRIEGYWRDAFKRWEILATDDVFWEIVSLRVKQLDDARLTTGFVRRMRSTLPQALDKINAELAMRHAEHGRMELARLHIQFMRETNQGLDDVEKTTELILTPITTRLKQQIQRARQRADKNSADAANAARELLDHAKRSLTLVDLFLGRDNEMRNELSDDVAGVCNILLVSYRKATDDYNTCLEIGNAVLSFATTRESRQQLEQNIAVWMGFESSTTLEPLYAICAAAASAAEQNPGSADKEAERLFAATSQILSTLSSGGVLEGTLNQARDEVALALMHCAVAFGNKTEKWKPCIAILEQSLGLAASDVVKEQVTKSHEMARKNHELYGNLTPISSAPSLNTMNGIGLTLYGRTDRESTTGSYLSTYYFVVFGIPVFPICRYRVTNDGNSYRFLGKAPLRTFDKWHLAISVGIMILLIIVLSFAGNTSIPSRSSSTPSVSAQSNYPAPYTAPLPTYTAPSSTYTTPSSNTAPSPYGSNNESSYSVPSYISSELDRNKQAIEVEKTKAAALESQLEEYGQALESEKAKVDKWQSELESLSAEVERARAYLDQTDQAEVDDFNEKVNRCNAAIRSVRAENESANQMVGTYNALLGEVRAQNRVVNKMVDDYNAKLTRYGR